jgi:hypothetical protein
MFKNKAEKESYQKVLAAVKAEMAQPRVAESARTEAGKVSAATVKEVAKP